MLDRDQLTRLRQDVGQQGFAEIVVLFLQETDEGIRKLCQEDKKSNMASDLHFLKGAALNLGLQQFGDLCHKSEILARMGQEGKVDLQELQAIYQSSRAALFTYTKENAD